MKLIFEPGFDVFASFKKLHLMFSHFGTGNIRLGSFINYRFYRYDPKTYESTFINTELPVIAFYHHEAPEGEIVITGPSGLFLRDNNQLPLLIKALREVDCFVEETVQIKKVV